MPTESGPVLERAYPCRTGCAAMGCAVAFLAAVGCAAVFIMPFGWGKIQEGQGWELVLGCLIFGVCALLLPTLILAPVLLIFAIRELQQPQYLRVTATALFLPLRLRPPQDRESNMGDEAALKSQPEEIPYTAIRSIRREDGPGGGQLVIFHERSRTILTIQQYMMYSGDFDELEKILRALVPAAFEVPPPALPTNTTEL